MQPINLIIYYIFENIKERGKMLMKKQISKQQKVPLRTRIYYVTMVIFGIV